MGARRMVDPNIGLQGVGASSAGAGKINRLQSGSIGMDPQVSRRVAWLTQRLVKLPNTRLKAFSTQVDGRDV